MSNSSIDELNEMTDSFKFYLSKREEALTRMTESDFRARLLPHLLKDDADMSILAAVARSPHREIIITRPNAQGEEVEAYRVPALIDSNGIMRGHNPRINVRMYEIMEAQERKLAVNPVNKDQRRADAIIANTNEPKPQLEKGLRMWNTILKENGLEHLMVETKSDEAEKSEEQVNEQQEITYEEEDL